MTAPPEVQEWLRNNGCSDRDLYFMFSRREAADQQVPALVAEWWQYLREQPPPSLPGVADLVPLRAPPSWAPAFRAAQSVSAPRLRVAAKRWAGVPQARVQDDKAWTADAERRVQHARRALSMIMSWPLGPVSAARRELAQPDWESWAEDWVQSMARSTNVQQYVSAWGHFQRFCQSRGWSAWNLTEPQFDIYLRSPTPKGKIQSSVAHRRFHALAWCQKHWGATVPTVGRQAPVIEHAGRIMDEQQAVAADPWILLEAEALAVPPWTPASSAAAQVWLLWASALRFSHLGRSVFTALTKVAVYGVCSLGKRSPGYRWAIPRYGPSGADVGGQLFARWHELSHARGKPLPSLAFDLCTGAPLTHNDMRSAIPAVFTAAGAGAAELATTYSLRRGAATLCSVRGASELSEAANGFWLSKRHVDMPARYHGRRVHKALEVKLHTFEAVRRAMSTGDRLTWAVVGLLLREQASQEIRGVAQQQLAGDSVVTPVSPDWTAVPPVPREFGVGTEAAPVQAAPEPVQLDVGLRAAAPEAAASRPKRGRVPAERAADPWPEHWQATEHSGQLIIHFLNAADALPVCRRRRGATKAKPISRVQLAGSSLYELRELQSSARLCDGCAKALRRTNTQLWADALDQGGAASSSRTPLRRTEVGGQRW